jgi:hypothetical protein
MSGRFRFVPFWIALVAAGSPQRLMAMPTAAESTQPSDAGVPTAGTLAGKAHAATASPHRWRVASGTIHYVFDHPLTRVGGASQQIAGVAELDARGLTVGIESALSAFFTAPKSRDARILDLWDAAHYPAVSAHAFVSHFQMPEGRETFDVPMTLAVKLHGLSTEVPVLVRVRRLVGDRLIVNFALIDSIQGHKLRRPRFYFWPIRDDLSVRGELILLPDV